VWGAYLGEEALEEGVDVMVSSWRKHASSQVPTNVKTTGLYVNSMLAGEEARRNGYVEAIVLNKEGNVAEGPGENIFMVNDGEIYTTGPAQSILEGITRDTVIELAKERGYTVHDEAVISRGQLYTADELFFTGSAVEVTPIRSVDDTEIGSGTCARSPRNSKAPSSTSWSGEPTPTTTGSRTCRSLFRRFYRRRLVAFTASVRGRTVGLTRGSVGADAADAPRLPGGPLGRSLLLDGDLMRGLGEPGREDARHPSSTVSPVSSMRSGSTSMTNPVVMFGAVGMNRTIFPSRVFFPVRNAVMRIPGHVSM